MRGRRGARARRWGSLGVIVLLCATLLAGCRATGIASVAIGYSHACALTTSGTVACWGDNSAGQLGDGTQNPHLVPAPVRGLADVRGIGVGASSSCAVLGDGTVRCWGQNNYGQLGDGTGLPQLSPVLKPWS